MLLKIPVVINLICAFARTFVLIMLGSNDCFGGILIFRCRPN